MSDRLPAVVELCPRPFNANVCGGIIYRPQPETIVCSRCGGSEAGVVYTNRQKIIATAVLYLGETLAGSHPSLARAYRHAAVNLEAVLTNNIEVTRGAALFEITTDTTRPRTTKD